MLCQFMSYSKKVGGLHPCGQCLPCRFNSRKKITARLILESYQHEKSMWVCLTYALDNEPSAYVDSRTGECFVASSRGTLSPSDLESFIDRLRDKFPPRTFRYFAAGEYGDDSGQPHYHICFFGIGPESFQKCRDTWTDPVSGLPIGIVSLDADHINWDNAQYTAGYTVKKMTKPDDPRLVGRYPEFRSSSKGIGCVSVQALAKALQSVSAQAYIESVGDIPRKIIINGKELPIDRYMRQKILALLKIEDFAKAVGNARFQKEMLRLQVRGETAAAKIGSLPSLAYALESQYKKENMQKVLNSVTRFHIQQKDRNL